MRRSPIVCALLIALTADAQMQVQMQVKMDETITVARVLLDVRVTQMNGEPILGLTKDDFTVTLGGKPAPVESVTWVPETSVARVIAGVEDEDAPLAPATEENPMPRGRLFVVFVQTDFARSTEHLRGHMHFLTYAQDMIRALEPDDRVAVFSFDSQLRFWLDFTADKDRVAEIIADTATIGQPPTPPVVPIPSLARRFDRDAARNAATSEEGLTVVGNALRGIPGPKSLILMGWGLGHRWAGGVLMGQKYTIARHVLEAARVTIFALDTVDADYHTLEAGLEKAAEDTGGFYAKTHIFPKIALDKLQRTLSGHYELEVRRPEKLKPGTHDVIVNVKRRGATVLAPMTYMDRG